MGIRLNPLNNALPSLRMESAQPRTPAVSVTQPSLAPAESMNGRPPAPLPPNDVGGQTAPFAAAPAQEQADAPIQPLEAVIEADRGVDGLQQTANRPAARVRAFRFLMAAESGRGRELDARYNQLERRLSTVSARLQRAESIMVQIDAQLERARLQQDLEMVADEIRRIRLEQVFERVSTPVAEAAEPEPSQSSPVTSPTFAPTRQPALNLLA